jgi:hypothetical protein
LGEEVIEERRHSTADQRGEKLLCNFLPMGTELYYNYYPWEEELSGAVLKL